MNTAPLGTMTHRSYLAATSGRLEEAQTIIQEIRSEPAFLSTPWLVAEVILVEGVIAVYRGDIEYAKGRLTRVVAFCEQSPLNDLTALARGWLALIAYNDGDVVESAHLVARGLEFHAELSARSRLRLSTITSLLSAYVGLDEVARKWLLSARIAASELGVKGALSSVAFDLAVAALDRCSYDRLRGQLSANAAADVLVRVNSAKGYDAGAGSTLQPSLHMLAHGMALNLCGRYAEAREQILHFLRTEPTSRYGDSVCAKSELALANLGARDFPLEDAMEMELWSALSRLSDPIEKGSLIAVLIESNMRRGLMDRAMEMKILLDEQIQIRMGLECDLSRVLHASGMISPPDNWMRANDSTVGGRSA